MHGEGETHEVGTKDAIVNMMIRRAKRRKDFCIPSGIRAIKKSEKYTASMYNARFNVHRQQFKMIQGDKLRD